MSVFRTTHYQWSSVTQSDIVLKWLQGWTHPCGGSVSVCVYSNVTHCCHMDCRLHALLLSLHTCYIWGHATCYIAAPPNWWDLIARDSPTSLHQLLRECLRVLLLLWVFSLWPRSTVLIIKSRSAIRELSKKSVERIFVNKIRFCVTLILFFRDFD